MFVYEQSLKKKMCPNLVHNFKEFLVVEDLNQMREKNVQMANIVGLMRLILMSWIY